MRLLPSNLIPSIQFDTKVWENDYRLILSKGHLEKLANLISIPTSNIRILINNVVSRRHVNLLAQRAKKSGLIGDFFFVDELAPDVLKHFDLKKDALGSGYRYSICELAGLYLSKKPYILHLSGDSLPAANIDPSFFELSAELFKRNEKVRVTNLMWNESLYEHISQSTSEDSDFWYSEGGFSDQMYFVKSDHFKERIFKFIHPDSGRYPSAAGPLFEKRVDSWMRVNGYLRATFKHNAYRHTNFPTRLSAKLLRKLRGTGN